MHVCVFTRRERSKIPLIVRQCVEEIERRGMDEVGIYRVSGVATDIQALKAAFDSSAFSLHLRSDLTNGGEMKTGVKTHCLVTRVSFAPQTTRTCVS